MPPRFLSRELPTPRDTLLDTECAKRGAGCSARCWSATDGEVVSMNSISYELLGMSAHMYSLHRVIFIALELREAA